MDSVVLAYRYWRQHGYNPFEDGDDSWYSTGRNTIGCKNSEDDIKAIAKKYQTTSNHLYKLIDIAYDRDIARSLGDMGGRTIKHKRLEER